MMEKNQKQYSLIERIGSWAGSLLKIAALAALALYGYTWWQEHPAEAKSAVFKAAVEVCKLSDKMSGKSALKRDVRTQASVFVTGLNPDSPLAATEVKVGEITLPAGKDVRLTSPLSDRPADPGKVYVVAEVVAAVDRADLESAFNKIEKSYGKADKGEKPEK